MWGNAKCLSHSGARESGRASGNQSYSVTERFLCASWQRCTAGNHNVLGRVCSTDTQTHIYALQDVSLQLGDHHMVIRLFKHLTVFNSKT